MNNFNNFGRFSTETQSNEQVGTGKAFNRKINEPFNDVYSWSS